MKQFIKRRLPSVFKGHPHVALPKPLEIPSSLRVLVFAPHADDETIGCGGTLLQLVARGALIRVVFVTDGALGDPQGWVEGRVAEVRQAEARSAMATLGALDAVFLDFPDGGLDPRDPALRDALSAELRTFRPDWVFAPGCLEFHRDHVAVGALLLWLKRRGGLACRWFLYEVSGGFSPNRIVDIGTVMAQKRALLECYRLPLRYLDYQTAMEGQALARGVLLGKGPTTRYAEVFDELGPEPVWLRVLASVLLKRLQKD